MNDWTVWLGSAAMAVAIDCQQNISSCGFKRGNLTMILSLLNNLDHVIHKSGKVGDAVVDICGFIDSNQGLIKDHEEVLEQL